MVRERRREGAPPPPQEVGTEELACFRVMGASGKRVVDGAGLRAITLDEAELLRGLSQGRVLCRRKEPGLVWEPEDTALRGEMSQNLHIGRFILK